MNYWEDIEIGRNFETGEITVTAADIIDFATKFDPQPYHLDPAVAEHSIFGGHCASGWQICALMMRLLVDTMNRDGVRSVGSAEVESLRWHRPVFANDTLNAQICVTGRKPSTDYKQYGLIDCAIEVVNQSGEKVISLTTDMLIEREEEVTDE
ncbi:hypothetical protein AB833_26545 [Chromatiales bacterium (ex Bugula neritina AB1)]|nr:hypothetical protein AB833_26545 [Chromatiales bacterium (ex Bugula neritina AB1)]